MKTKIILIAIMSSFLFSSCATMFTGTKQKVTFKSNVDGKVYQNLSEIGKTNEPIKIKRKDLVKLYTIKTEGCTDKQFELPVKSNPAALLNIPFAFFGYGIIWAYIDESNGANMKTNKIIEVNVECGSNATK